jgi:glycosyltransferase involved in cell wall biosynthesis
MPAYNHERFVGAAIESVLKQSLGDLELIIVNDGSRDGTERVIRTFDDPRIRYFYQENRGAHNAINFGVSLAWGRYLAIINSDDVYLEERLERLKGVLENSGARLAFSDLTITEAKLDPLPVRYPTVAWFERVKGVYRQSGSLLHALLSGNWVVTTSNLFIETSFARQIGPFANYRYTHDYDFVLRALTSCGAESIAFCDEKLLLYRLHQSNTVKENFINLQRETLAVLRRHIPNLMSCQKDRDSVGYYLAYVDEMLSQEYNLLDDFVRTRSWRITRPLRQLMDYCQRRSSNMEDGLPGLISLKSAVDFFLGAASRIFVRLPFRVRMCIVKSLNNVLLYFGTRS